MSASRPAAFGLYARAACAVVTGVSVGLMLWAGQTHHRAFFRPLVPVASSGFVLLAVASGAHRTWYGRLVLLGLVFCWIGDVIGPGNFAAGTLSFLLGHIAFSGAFCTRSPSWPRLGRTALGVLVSSGALFVWLYPHVPAEDRLLVVAYLVVISLMVVLAGGFSRGRAGGLIVTAAVLFYVSDIFVARWRFVAPGFVNGLFCYPIYYTACVLFAYTIAASRQQRSARPG